MAILHRFGSADDFDPSKMLARELAYVNTTNANFKAGLYLCYAPGDVRRQTTEEDIVNILNASPEAYSALQNLITDLTADPNELANILNNIADLQANKINKSDIIQTDTISNPTKVPSSVVTEALGKEIDTINNNLASQAASLVYDGSPTQAGLLINTGKRFSRNNNALQVLKIWGYNRAVPTPIDTMLHLTNGPNSLTYFNQYNRAYSLPEIKLFVIDDIVYIYLPKLNSYSVYILESHDASYISNATWEENEPTVYDATFTAIIG